MKQFVQFLTFLVCSTVLWAGCGSHGGVAKVEGIVTLDGQPLPDIHVLFQPAGAGEGGGMSSYGMTDSAGKFSLRLSDSQRAGATVGINTVILSDKRAEEPEESDAGFSKGIVSRIPASYTRDPIQFRVEAGKENFAEIALTSDRKR